LGSGQVKLLPICHKEADNLNILLVCGGAANVGLAGYLAAVELTKEGKARMCCITPVGAGSETYIDIARRAKKLVVINGCQNQCASRVLEQAGVKPDHVIVVSEVIKKIPTFDINEEDVQLVKRKIEEALED
jgi:uncharacterized metal-binding protein